jgi:hypothetical protein
MEVCLLIRRVGLLLTTSAIEGAPCGHAMKCCERCDAAQGCVKWGPSP